jgi:hypothetical protein
VNTAELDEWFARADDVLDNWHPSQDAMVARVDEEDADIPAADSYYEQGWARADRWFIEAVDHLIVGDIRRPPTPFIGIQHDLSQALEIVYNTYEWSLPPVTVTRYYVFDETKLHETPFERAIRLRRERNTGPTSRIGLDGHHR